MLQPCGSGCGGCNAKRLIRVPRRIVRREILFASFTWRQFMFSLNVNGQTVEVDADPHTPLLWVLRDHIGLVGTKFGCGIAQCGACTVHVDGAATRSCQLPLESAVGTKIV